MHLVPRLSEKPCSLVVNWLRVELRIGDRHLDMQVSDVGTSPPLDYVLFVAVWVRVFVSPGLLFLERDRVDNKSVAVPGADLFTEKRGVWIVSVFASVEWNKTIRGVPVEEDCVVSALQELEGKATCVVPRKSTYDADSLWIDGMFKVVFECSFAGRSER